tara:strand:- start:5007 stop:6293 length:1287 start_codon:yes stop_codon:yes gene_type:complete
VKRLAIFVATTGGPAQIDRLTPEYAPHSMVCLKRGSDILPISGDYDDFVKRGSGVIEREFGPFDYASFRMDVTESIGVGKSWQLGVFAAHAVVASESAELADKDASPDQVIWLTGEVDYDLGVVSVGHIAEKVAASKTFFDNWHDAGVPVLALVPQAENLVEIDQAELPEGVELVGLSSTAELIAQLGLGPTDAQPIAGSAKSQTGTSSAVASIIGTLLISVLILWAYMSGVNQEAVKPAAEKAVQKSAEKLPPPPKPKKLAEKKVVQPRKAETITVSERRPPAGGTCAKVHFGRIEAETQPIQSSNGDIAVSTLKNLCGLKFDFDLGAKSKFIAANLDIESGAFVRGNVKPKLLSGITKTKGKQSWTIDVPRRLAEPLQYRLNAIIGKEPVAAEMQWLKRQSDWNQAVKTLAQKGFSVLTWRHKITP